MGCLIKIPSKKGKKRKEKKKKDFDPICFIAFIYSDSDVFWVGVGKLEFCMWRGGG